MASISQDYTNPSHNKVPKGSLLFSVIRIMVNAQIVYELIVKENPDCHHYLCQFHRNNETFPYFYFRLY